jgi:putative transposase
MPDYRRAFLPGGTFFFTVVTYRRFPIFNSNASINLLRDCFKYTIRSYPFKIDATVILPDHIHAIWTLPNNTSDYSLRWKIIKSTFSHRYKGPKITELSKSMIMKHESGIWQRRFWEHQIRNEDDFNRHCDYIHYNPVKHKLVQLPADWEYSSLKSFIKKGLYSDNWGQQVPVSVLSLNFE